MTQREPPKQLVRDLLRGDPNDASTGWDTDNTFGFKPSIKYGWFDSYDTASYVIIRQPDENPLGGGETGYAYMTNAGPGREVDGTIGVHVFASDRKIKDNDTVTTDHGAEYVWGADAADDGTLGDRGAVGEIERIIGANEVRPTNPITGNQPVRFLSLGASNAVDEPDEGPFFHHVIEVGYIFADD